MDSFLLFAVLLVLVPFCAGLIGGLTAIWLAGRAS